jgi:hypothetical protein
MSKYYEVHIFIPKIKLFSDRDNWKVNTDLSFIAEFFAKTEGGKEEETEASISSSTSDNIIDAEIVQN